MEGSNEEKLPLQTADYILLPMALLNESMNLQNTPHHTTCYNALNHSGAVAPLPLSLTRRGVALAGVRFVFKIHS